MLAAGLPTGTVTLLLTDIEGSTRLWEYEPAAMRVALARHDALIAETVADYQGHVLKSRGEGDSLFCVFERAGNALQAAVAIQRRLRAERWPTYRPIHVRMALHTGAVERRERDYYGPAVNRCARLRGLAHGGQVLLSGVTAALAHDRPLGIGLLDLGMHPLRDLSTPEHVYQLLHADLPREFPPLGAPPVEPAPAEVAVVASGADDTARRLFLLVEAAGTAADGRHWCPGVTQEGAAGGRIRCYPSVALAVLATTPGPLFRPSHAWEVLATPQEDAGATFPIPCLRATPLRRVPIPTLTAEQAATFGVLCAREVYQHGLCWADFQEWADAWLAGAGRSLDVARAVSRLVDADTYRRASSNGGALAASHALTAVIHALSAPGRPLGPGAIERAREAALEAMAVALHLRLIDVVALADRALGIAPPALDAV